MCDIEKQFLENVKDHSMQILLDNGVYRHLKFSRGNSSTYRFDLITFPGHLVITGDMGDLLFERVEDMFSFFRSSKINPGYWSEKLQAKDGDILEFDFDDFKEQVDQYVNDYCESSELDQDAIDDLKAEVESEIFDRIFDGSSIDEAHRALYDFEYGDFKFVDSFEWDFTQYTHHYIWKLYAIVWGIQKYDGYFITVC